MQREKLSELSEKDALIEEFCAKEKETSDDKESAEEISLKVSKWISWRKRKRTEEVRVMQLNSWKKKSLKWVFHSPAASADFTGIDDYDAKSG